MTNRVLRVALFDTFRALGTWRWFAVPPVFVIGGWLGADHARFVMEVLPFTPGKPNFWDGALILPTNKYALIFPFVLGFVLVTGDLYVRDLDQGTATLTVPRSRSRMGWWTSKVLSLAPLALLYSVLAYLSALVGSALILPLAAGSSQAADIPWGVDVALYPRLEGVPITVFLLLVVLYTAFALWAIGSLVLASSTFHPHSLVPLGAGLAWVFVGLKLEEPLLYQGEFVLNPIYHVTYVSHFETGGVFGVVPWIYAAVALGGTLLLALVTGGLRIRRVDL